MTVIKPTPIQRLVREPLLHFLVLGATLFVLYGATNDGQFSSGTDQIVVDEAEVARLSDQFRRTWMRPPTREELAGLAEEFVREEILYREALALGLDKNDLVIRRRMRQKMEFLNADVTDRREPTDDELQAYLDANPEQFLLPARYSFQHIYIGSDETDGARRAAELLTRLQTDPALGADPQSLGDATLLPPALEQASEREVASVFGAEFAGVVAGMSKDAWLGPYSSAYGLHLIRLVGKQEGSLPQLAQIRPTVEREWSNEQRQKADDRFYQELRSRYSVEIRLPETSGSSQTLAVRTL